MKSQHSIRVPRDPSGEGRGLSSESREGSNGALSSSLITRGRAAWSLLDKVRGVGEYAFAYSTVCGSDVEVKGRYWIVSEDLVYHSCTTFTNSTEVEGDHLGVIRYGAVEHSLL